MATATKQLEAIYQEITERFSANPGISVSPLDGEPPEKYQITYHLIGIYKDDSGEIQERDTHVITLSIPFGFPHFPPSCKPKSPIFHPDFDPAAICIGDFWENDRTISDLIEYIGQLITGQIFSTSNAFNEEALNWYQNNSDKLPFDSLDSNQVADDLTLDSNDSLGQVDEADLTIAGGGGDGPAELFADLSVDPDPVPTDTVPDKTPPDLAPSEEDGIDTLDDSFLETDYDFLGPDQAETETDGLVPPKPTEPRETESEQTLDPERLRLMARQKRFFELESELASLAAHHNFPGRETLASQAAEALQKARDFYQQGTTFEHQGSPGSALDAFNQAEATVSDYPGLAEDIERTIQAKELLGDWTAAPTSDDTAEAAPEAAPTVPTAAQEQPATRTFFEDAAQTTSKVVPYAIGVALMIALAALGGYYFLNVSKLNNAGKKFAECQTTLQQNRFPEAQRQCQSALEIAKGIQFLKGGARDQLTEKIDQVLNSQALIEGLAGKLYLDGNYLPKKVVQTIFQFRHFMSEGDRYFDQDSWQQATASYQQALDIADNNQGIDPELIFSAAEKLKLAQFRVLLRSGREYIDRGKWVLATKDLNQALEHLQELNIENKVEMVDSITKKLSGIALATAKEEGDAAFAAGNWDQALTHYKKALEAAKDASKSDGPTVAQLNDLLVKAQLYSTINEGKDAFTKANWDDAIERYEQAITLLESNREILKQASTTQNRKKLARIMLQASVIRDKQDAARFLKDHQYASAIDKMNSIIDTIAASQFSDEEEFAAVIADARTSIDQANTNLLLEDKISYLEENFVELFTTHYTVSSPESLTEPTVLFEKRIDDILLFRLQCIEIGRGRPLRLAMRYAHNLTTGKWNFYKSNQ